MLPTDKTESEFEVDSIKNIRKQKTQGDSQIMVEIAWKNYPDNNTWEPCLENLSESTAIDLLNKYKESLEPEVNRKDLKDLKKGVIKTKLKICQEAIKLWEKKLAEEKLKDSDDEEEQSSNNLNKNSSQQENIEKFSEKNLKTINPISSLSLLNSLETSNLRTEKPNSHPEKNILMDKQKEVQNQNTNNIAIAKQLALIAPPPPPPPPPVFQSFSSPKKFQSDSRNTQKIKISENILSFNMASNNPSDKKIIPSSTSFAWPKNLQTSYKSPRSQFKKNSKLASDLKKSSNQEIVRILKRSKVSKKLVSELNEVKQNLMLCTTTYNPTNSRVEIKIQPGNHTSYKKKPKIVPLEEILMVDPNLVKQILMKQIEDNQDMIKKLKKQVENQVGLFEKIRSQIDFSMEG